MARNGDRSRSIDLQDRRRRVFEAWTKGRPQYQIAQDEQVHPGQIVRDLDAVLAELKARDLDDKERARLDALARISTAEKELWDAWERSKKPKERNKAKKTTPGSNLPDGQAIAGQTKSEAEKVTEGRDGNPKFMGELRALWELRAKLLGLHRDPDEGGGNGPSMVIKVYGFNPNGRPGTQPAIGPPPAP